MRRINNEDRAYLTEMRAISTDSNGNEILVGLNIKETEFYMEYTNQSTNPQPSNENRDRYILLHDKHEAARLSVINAEVELREEAPSKH